jgi:hypothetical protein
LCSLETLRSISTSVGMYIDASAAKLIETIRGTLTTTSLQSCARRRAVDEEMPRWPDDLGTATSALGLGVTATSCTSTSRLRVRWPAQTTGRMVWLTFASVGHPKETDKPFGVGSPNTVHSSHILRVRLDPASSIKDTERHEHTICHLLSPQTSNRQPVRRAFADRGESGREPLLRLP